MDQELQENTASTVSLQEKWWAFMTTIFHYASMLYKLSTMQAWWLKFEVKHLWKNLSFSIFTSFTIHGMVWMFQLRIIIDQIDDTEVLQPCCNAGHRLKCCALFVFFHWLKLVLLSVFTVMSFSFIVRSCHYGVCMFLTYFCTMGRLWQKVIFNKWSENNVADSLGHTLLRPNIRMMQTGI